MARTAVWTKATLQTKSTSTRDPELSWGPGFRVPGSGFRVSGFGCQVSAFEFRIPGFGFQVSGFGFQVKPNHARLKQKGKIVFQAFPERRAPFEEVDSP